MIHFFPIYVEKLEVYKEAFNLKFIQYVRKNNNKPNFLRFSQDFLEVVGKAGKPKQLKLIMLIKNDYSPLTS